VRFLILLIAALLMAGCAGNKKTGVSRHDPYEAATIDEMVGNNVSGQVFARTIVCLNGRRECRISKPVTNTVVTWSTNVSLSFVTNRTVTVVTNASRTLATNTVAATPAPPHHDTVAAEIVVPSEVDTSTSAVNSTNAPTIATETPGVAETNQLVTVPPSTNDTHTASSNTSTSTAGNQTVTTAATQLQLSHQVTLTTNNLSITTADNEFVSVETNEVVITLTNQAIAPVTNAVVSLSNELECDYYLCLELAPPPDFILATGGESLVLAIDGVRHGFSPATPQAGTRSRRGYTTTHYKAT
jgi:hypothetical protein